MTNHQLEASQLLVVNWNLILNPNFRRSLQTTCCSTCMIRGGYPSPDSWRLTPRRSLCKMWDHVRQGNGRIAKMEVCFSNILRRTVQLGFEDVEWGNWAPKAWVDNLLQLQLGTVGNCEGAAADEATEQVHTPLLLLVSVSPAFECNL